MMVTTLQRRPTIVVKNPHNLPTVRYSELLDSQGDLKMITAENLEKLKRSILKHGIIVPKFVWRASDGNGNHAIYTIDGHQTVKALRSLETDGYCIPDIPVVEIQAGDRREAAEILLKISSTFGYYNPSTTFFADFDLDIQEIKFDIEIPELFFDSDVVEQEISQNLTQKKSDINDNAKTKNECPNCGHKW